ncbi:MAG: hypothetical protein Q8R33_07295 [Burkholderiales bacterium]|nr:hypothetical protein [Burkholderiales bacterium]
MMKHRLEVTAALMAACVLAACQTTQGGAAPAPAAAAPVPAKPAEGDTRRVKGINDWEGDITGKPGPGSRFGQLQIGMPMKQVTDLVGPPTDQGVYATGKAFIPFNWGSDRYRQELVYKGQGRLIFAGGGRWHGSYSSSNLVWIIHNSAESGYR